MRKTKVTKIVDGKKLSLNPDHSGDSFKSAFYLPKIELSEVIKGTEPNNYNTLKEKKGNSNRFHKIQSEGQQFSNWILPALFIVLLLVVLFYILSFFRASENISALPQGDPEKAMPANDPDPDKIKDLFSSEMLIKYAGILNADILKKGCVIITGSFSDEGNANRTYTFIESQGYNAYMEQEGNKKRVGILFDCGKIDLDEFLIEVRENINPDAWYLRPDYDPEL